jgi:hypothetical protein
MPWFRDESNIACIDHLPLPDYPALARAAGLHGIIAATATLSPDASVEQITTDFNSDSAESRKLKLLLEYEVREVLRRAIFRSNCGGKAIKVVFRFEINGEPSSYNTRVAFGYPNQFWVTTRPSLAESESNLKSKPQ